MSTAPTKEPFPGEELIRIQIETYQIHFVFSKTVLQIGGAFSITSEQGILAEFNPGMREGDLPPIWGLIGDKVAKTVWDDEITILFVTGCKILIPAAGGQIRGAILGQTENGRVIFEDF